jgi:hypothetical protein
MNGTQENQTLQFVLIVIALIGLKKRCVGCGDVKNIDEFHIDKRAKDKRESSCIECHKKRSREYYAKNPEQKKQYRLKHIERINKYQKKWRIENKEKAKAAADKWRERNTEKVIKTRVAGDARRRGTARGKLNDNISNRIYCSLHGLKKGKKWESLVGYTVDKLKSHIEKQFTDGMTWDNHGRYGWHVDHKIPITAFNFQSPQDIDFKKCWALSNLQPLWWRDNIKKSNKLDCPFQPSLCI